MKDLLLILIAMNIAACASASFDKAMNTWVGQTEDHLYDKWGAPTQVFKKPRGGSMIVYEKVGRTTTQMVGNVAVSRTHWCKTTFVTDSEGIIQSWDAEGNAC